MASVVPDVEAFLKEIARVAKPSGNRICKSRCLREACVTIY
ncbi:class I SAM-dependent methyltransferase [Legionella micdadei]|nr:class I SAM-dependent methyltransferase [Legionella micdadei]